MAMGWALGSGFVNAAVKRQEEYRDERRENRRLSMEVFIKDTLPQIRAARAADDAAVERMNTLMQDDFYKGNPGLAFYATKWMKQNEKDEAAFREHVASNQIPDELKARQTSAMAEHFNYDAAAGTVSWRVPSAAAPAAPVAPAGPRPSFWDKIMGKSSVGADINRGTMEAAKAAGVDPNAATTSRFSKINIPGGYKTVDPLAEKNLDRSLRVVSARIGDVRDPGAFAGIMATGDTAKISAAISDPKFFYGEDEKEAKENRSAARQFILSGVSGGTIAPEALKTLDALNDPEKMLASAAKYLKTDAQKLDFARKMAMIEAQTGALSSDAGFVLKYEAGLLKDMPGTDPKTLEKAYTAAKKRAADAAAAKTSLEDLLMGKLLGGAPVVAPAAAVEEEMEPAVEEAKEAPAPAAALPKLDREKLLKEGAPLSGAVKRKYKLGEIGGEEDVYDDPKTIVNHAPAEVLRRVSADDPVKYLRSLDDLAKAANFKVMFPERAREVVNNLTVSVDTYQKLSPTYEKYDASYAAAFNEQVNKYRSLFTPYESMQAAIEAGHTNGDVVLVKGIPRVVVADLPEPAEEAQQ